MTVNCFGIPDTYRGWAISQGPDDRFYATGDGDPKHGADTWDDLQDILDDYAPLIADLCGSMGRPDALVSGSSTGGVGR